MSQTYISKETREKVALAARYQCGYCQTQQVVVGYPLHIEHLVPEALEGASTKDNLWLACSVCNNIKGIKTDALDPVTQRKEPLFNPRTQVWSEHFAWDTEGTHIIGLTSTGRATVEGLKLNTPLRVHSRKLWVSVGWHPPTPSLPPSIPSPQPPTS